MEPILESLQDGVLLLTLNRPDKKNAFNHSLWEGLRTSLARARENDEVSVVVLTGAGGNFSSGQDLTEFAVKAGESHPFDLAIEEIYDFDKPLLAAATGVSVGFGATCLFHCDLVFVGESLRLRLPFVSLGLVPEAASSYTLQTIIGAQHAAELFYTAEWVDATKAVGSGIALCQFPDDELLGRTLEKATEIAEAPLSSLQATKRVLKAPHQASIRAAHEAEQAGMRQQAGSPDNLEAMTAFMQKRKPDFRGLAGKT